jgi:uncharacterized membrane protein YcaP (DUF421 family)
MLDSDITADEVRAAVRRSGLISLKQVRAAVLENDGEWSIIPQAESPDQSALEGLALPDDGEVPASRPARSRAAPQATL